MMFTGIVEEIGTVAQVRRGQDSAVLTIHAKTVLENTKIGDSIAVNGICLTVTALFFNGFSADVMHETLNRSSLASLKFSRFTKSPSRRSFKTVSFTVWGITETEKSLWVIAATVFQRLFSRCYA